LDVAEGCGNHYRFSYKMTIQINPAFSRILVRSDLDSFEKIMNVAFGLKMREVPGRLTVRLDLGEGETFYLKRHTYPNADARMGGVKEWKNILSLSAAGILCPEPVATGSGNLRGKPCSFLITRAVPGMPLDAYLRSRYSQPIALHRLAEKRTLIQRLAAFARRFHLAGFHHKDFYLGHMYTPAQGIPDNRLYLIDLQRVGRARFFRRRWIVKDLAAMNYSATTDFTTAGDRLRFFFGYLGISRLTPASKRLIRAILRKTERIRKHDLNLQKRNLPR
jgi:hypothetical protein